ncbi:AMP-binding protein [Sphaerimonospora sp. CA-214678]|uniref:AMP-binding protein n=1 Tax=Sphaerimonospora sp. CA-214678 TaxID=3240029 RepID=UPI003D927BF0
MRGQKDSRVVPYSPDRVARYLSAGVWSTEPLAARFRAVALAHGARKAVIGRDGSMSYEELDLRTDQVAAAFLGRGLRPGQPVLMQVDNGVQGVVAWYAVLKAGAIPVATLAGHRAHEVGHIAGIVGAVGHIVDDARPERFDMVAFARERAVESPTLSLLFTVGSRREVDAEAIEDLGVDIEPGEARRAVDAAQADIGPEDVAVYQLSGGTTGAPKVIPRLHGEYWNNGLAWARALGRSERSVTCHAAPFIHNAGITCGLHATHSVGGCIVLPPTERTAALRMMRDHRVDDTIFGHGMFSWIMAEEYAEAGEHLRTVVLSGAKVPDEVFARVESFGARVAQTFGMGEGMFTLTPFDAPRELRSATVGPPMTTDDEVRILEPGGEEELPDGEIGELACRGWYTVPGYFAAPEHNQRAFTADGFYRTGDLARVEVHDGLRYLSIEGRIKDLINRGGEKVNAEELEQLLCRHTSIEEAAVVAMPDEHLGERVCAYLVSTDPDLGVPELQVHLDGLGVAKYKWPERVEIIGSLPRTQVGKLDKKALRDDIAARVGR